MPLRLQSPLAMECACLVWYTWWVGNFLLNTSFLYFIIIIIIIIIIISLIITITKFSNVIGYQLPWFQP